ncbi:unnamed protein product [Triticum turgidum subsp. durum]|uniref:GST N-terminal domain-containing protein n=1 Tax=Triticum turgidum subsp. durum TaxID=4567 RepID=A0A9R0R767_TRITD|nr:unnamed protein product [Triticum turgidum subsp. durum]
MAGGGGDEKVTLLGHWGSAYVTRVRLALHLKGVSYSYVEEDLRSKSDLLLRCNPVHRAVPVLIHHGRPVCESQISGDRLFGDAGRTPLLAAWLRRFGELDAAKALLPDVDRVVEYVRMIHAKNAVKAPAN